MSSAKSKRFRSSSVRETTSTLRRFTCLLFLGKSTHRLAGEHRRCHPTNRPRDHNSPQRTKTNTRPYLTSFVSVDAPPGGGQRFRTKSTIAASRCSNVASTPNFRQPTDQAWAPQCRRCVTDSVDQTALPCPPSVGVPTMGRPSGLPSIPLAAHALAPGSLAIPTLTPSARLTLVLGELHRMT